MVKRRGAGLLNSETRDDPPARGWIGSFGAQDLRVRFGFYSLLVIAAMAVYSAWAVGRYLEREMIRTSAESTAMMARVVIRPAVTGISLEKPLQAREYEMLDAAIKQNTLSEDLVRVKVWNRDRGVMYASDGGAIGQRFEDHEELEEALEGQLAAEVSTLATEENNSLERYGRLLEVYAPLTLVDGGPVVGAYEIYQTLAPIQARIGAAQRVVSIILAEPGDCGRLQGPLHG